MPFDGGITRWQLQPNKQDGDSVVKHFKKSVVPFCRLIFFFFFILSFLAAVRQLDRVVNFHRVTTTSDTSYRKEKRIPTQLV